VPRSVCSLTGRINFPTPRTTKISSRIKRHSNNGKSSYKGRPHLVRNVPETGPILKPTWNHLLSYNYQPSTLGHACMKQGTIYFGPTSLRAQICSSPMEDITVTTRSLPSPNPSLICIARKKHHYLDSVVHKLSKLASLETGDISNGWKTTAQKLKHICRIMGCRIMGCSFVFRKRVAKF